MVVRDFVVNGQRVRLNYSPDTYRLAAEIAGQSVTPKTVVAVARANPQLFPQVRIELVREDLRTIRYVPVVSQTILAIARDGSFVAFGLFFKCDKCGLFYRTKEETLACVCQKKKK